MSIWNLSVVGYFSWAHLAMGYVPRLITAFLLDLLVAGPVVKGVAFKFLTERHKPWQKILVVSGGMVSLMSLYDMLFNGVPLSVTNYLGAWLTNFIVAFPLNFLIVGPISRFILGQLQQQLF
ncbi:MULTISPECIES: DUF2798 domain-containing protein [Streptococcus]|nr:MULTISPECIES: hypothetical protein [Streptococcus]MDX5005225.1 DUF2798 domain-containing protein [Streptococcus anginosus]MDX5053437.1 DUF2798 domain-containing protein [Streptococcus anginosus]MDX5055296.1 DUF2798 domain-containing protein [Streptococcus anginosus]MDX5057300.1 DUF2798 domain-containing protein [Streptococcus anginosus]GAD42443.1 hypothetical protein ANG4_1036 [Streptococcus anginosus 1505]